MSQAVTVMLQELEAQEKVAAFGQYILSCLLCKRGASVSHCDCLCEDETVTPLGAKD